MITEDVAGKEDEVHWNWFWEKLPISMKESGPVFFALGGYRRVSWKVLKDECFNKIIQPTWMWAGGEGRETQEINVDAKVRDGESKPR